MVDLCQCSLKRFEQYSKEKKIYIFGMGQANEDFLKVHGDIHIHDRVMAFIDNNSSKNGGVRRIVGREVPVVAPSDCSFDNDSLVFIISTKYAEEIFRDIDSRANFDKIECFVYLWMEFSDDYIPIDNELLQSTLYRDQQIPKTLHWCWFGKGMLNDRIKYCIDSWHRFCPDYEIKLWNEDNYDVNKIPFTKKAYEDGMWAYVSDYARLDIIYQYGGIYLDTDVELLRSIDPLLQHKAFLGIEAGILLVNTGLTYGAVRGHELIARLMDDYHREDNLYNERGERRACPYIQTEALEEMGYVKEAKFQNVSGAAIYPPEYLCPVNQYTMICRTTENTYSIHHYAGTWAKEDDLAINDNKRELASYLQKRVRYIDA